MAKLRWELLGEGSPDTALPAAAELPRLPAAVQEENEQLREQLEITEQQPDETLVDRIEYIAVKMKDGTEQIVLDDAGNTDQTLYAMGFGPDAGFDSDTAVYVLAQTFALTDVQSVVINSTEYPLSA